MVRSDNRMLTLARCISAGSAGLKLEEAETASGIVIATPLVPLSPSLVPGDAIERMSICSISPTVIEA